MTEGYPVRPVLKRSVDKFPVTPDEVDLQSVVGVRCLAIIPEVRNLVVTFQATLGLPQLCSFLSSDGVLGLGAGTDRFPEREAGWINAPASRTVGRDNQQRAPLPRCAATFPLQGTTPVRKLSSYYNQYTTWVRQSKVPAPGTAPGLPR